MGQEFSETAVKHTLHAIPESGMDRTDPRWYNSRQQLSLRDLDFNSVRLFRWWQMVAEIVPYHSIAHRAAAVCVSLRESRSTCLLVALRVGEEFLIFILVRSSKHWRTKNILNVECSSGRS